MMIRTCSLVLLLTCCSCVLAQPLYKWTEADGSITFSPEKPHKGIDFQVITAAEGVTTSRIATRKPVTSKSNTPTSEQAPDAQLTRYDLSGTQHNASTIITNSSGSSAGQQASMSSMLTLASGQTLQSKGTASSAVQKQNRCEDLRKRVVSLERRLKSTLTAADMDNTVVHMSRYQKSYDQFCVQ